MMKFLLLLALLFSIHCEDLLFEKVHLVEYNTTTGNFFFRGNLPVLNESFAFDTLSAYMKNRSEAVGVAFPEDFSLLDFSLLWIVEEPFTDYKYEYNFWKTDESKTIGSFVEWPISFSGLVTPDMMPLSWAEASAKRFVEIDGMEEKVQRIHEILSTKLDKPQIIYAHCHYGCDRTGLMIGAYRMYYYDIKVEDMYQRNREECGRTENFMATESLKWFCLMLKEERNKDYGDCVGFASCVPWDYCTVNF